MLILKAQKSKILTDFDLYNTKKRPMLTNFHLKKQNYDKF